nr:zinc finger, CCHC-type [Tanacetum cinerariifolium]
MGVLVDSDKVKCVASKLGCLILKTSFSYLSSKVGGSMSRVHTWNEVVDRVKNRLYKWKMKTLSIRDRGLMFKWMWRFYTQNTSLWVRVIKAIHGDDGKVGRYVKDDAKSCWLSIVNEINSLKNKDRWIWALESSGDFSVPSVKTDSLSTRFNVSHRGIHIDSIMCAICDKVAETSSNLFFSCCMARQTVRMITRWWDVPYGEFDSYEDWINVVGGRYSGSTHTQSKVGDRRLYLQRTYNERPVMEQFNELLKILGQYTQHSLKMDESISASSVIDNHLCIDESLRAQKSDKGKRKEVAGTSVNMIEEGENNKNNKQNKGKKHGFKDNNDGSGSNKKPELECWKYGNTGHFKRDCRNGNKKNNASASGSGKGFKDQSQDQEESLRAQESDKGKRKEVAGTSVNMIEEGEKNKNNIQNKGKKHGFKDNNDGSGSNKKPELECWKYGKTGHFKRDCRSGNKKNNASASGSRKGSKDQSQDQGQNLVDAITWWIDSGDTTHVCKDHCWFKTYEPMKNRFVLYMGDDHFSPVHEKESVLYLVKGSRDQIRSQYFYCYSIKEDPRSYNEAMQSRDVAFWKEAIDDEFGSIMENNTWVLSDLPPVCKPLVCKWIFKKKMKVDGTIGKFKVRLVIQGFTQKEGIDFFNTYTPVARITRLLLALEAIHNLVIHQMDVKAIFLNGDLEEEVYMKQSEGFVMLGETNVILGIKIKRKNKGIVITQSHYIEKILQKFNREDCFPVSTPMDPVEKIMQNIGYSDANWINHVKDSYSTSGWVFLLGGGAISWAFKKQTCITGSTMESVFVALAAASEEA